MSVRAPLRESKRNGAIVRVERAGRLGWFDGVVLDYSADFVLLAVLDDRIRYNGFSVVRLDLVTHVEAPHPYESFYERALALRGDATPVCPELELGSMAAVIAGAGAAFSIITLHRELSEPDVCHIGQVLATNDQITELREISPVAVWDEAATRYDTSEVTRVDFGGGYEEALLLVATGTPLRGF